MYTATDFQNSIPIKVKKKNVYSLYTLDLCWYIYIYIYNVPSYNRYGERHYNNMSGKWVINWSCVQSLNPVRHRTPQHIGTYSEMYYLSRNIYNSINFVFYFKIINLKWKILCLGWPGLLAPSPPHPLKPSLPIYYISVLRDIPYKRLIKNVVIYITTFVKKTHRIVLFTQLQFPVEEGGLNSSNPHLREHNSDLVWTWKLMCILYYNNHIYISSEIFFHQWFINKI